MQCYLRGRECCEVTSKTNCIQTSHKSLERNQAEGTIIRCVERRLTMKHKCKLHKEFLEPFHFTRIRFHPRFCGFVYCRNKGRFHPI